MLKKPTFESITKGLAKTQQKLIALAEHHEEQGAVKEQRVGDLQAEIEDHAAEAKRCTTVATNIENLLSA